MENKPLKKPDNKYHHGDLKRTLVHAGEQIIEKNGVNGLSLREVAKAAGVSHTAPYRHFHDKADLLAAIAVVGFEKVTNSASEAARAHEDPKKQFTEAAIQYVLFGVRHPQMANLLFGGVINMKKAPKALKQASWAAFELVEAIINNGKKAGVFKDISTIDLAVTGWSGVHGLAQLINGGYLTRLASTEDQVKQVGKMVCDLLLRGVLK